MTDQEIYKKLRIDGEERDEFIDSLEGEMIHRAFEINEMMNRAYDNGYLDELDREYKFEHSEQDSLSKEEEKEIEKMNQDFDLLIDLVNNEEPVEEVKEEVQEEVKEMPSEEDAPSYEQESNDMSFSNFEESGIASSDSLFEVDKGPVSDLALDRLMKEAELISNSAHKDNN